MWGVEGMAMYCWDEWERGHENEEFERYINNSIVPLFSNLEDMLYHAQGWQHPRLQLAGPAQQVSVQGTKPMAHVDVDDKDIN